MFFPKAYSAQLSSQGYAGPFGAGFAIACTVQRGIQQTLRCINHGILGEYFCTPTTSLRQDKRNQQGRHRTHTFTSRLAARLFAFRSRDRASCRFEEKANQKRGENWRKLKYHAYYGKSRGTRRWGRRSASINSDMQENNYFAKKLRKSTRFDRMGMHQVQKEI